MSKLLHRLVYWIRRHRMEREVVEEIELHRELKDGRLLRVAQTSLKNSCGDETRRLFPM